MGRYRNPKTRVVVNVDDTTAKTLGPEWVDAEQDDAHREAEAERQAAAEKAPAKPRAAAK